MFVVLLDSESITFNVCALPFGSTILHALSPPQFTGKYCIVSQRIYLTAIVLCCFKKNLNLGTKDKLKSIFNQSLRFKERHQFRGQDKANKRHAEWFLEFV